MISKIPTFSLKAINFNSKYSPWIFLLIAIVCVGLLSNVWMTMIIIASSYFISIVYTVFKNKNFKSQSY